MQEVITYKVYNRTFDNKQEASEYEKKLLSNLDNIAWNLNIFYHRMLCYPGEITALELIDSFTRNNLLKFGKYKGNRVGRIILLDPQYIAWLIKNVPSFKLTPEEEALYKAKTKPIHLGGCITDFSTDETYYYEGDSPDYELIDWLREYYNKSNKEKKNNYEKRNSHNHSRWNGN